MVYEGYKTSLKFFIKERVIRLLDDYENNYRINRAIYKIEFYLLDAIDSKDFNIDNYNFLVDNYIDKDFLDSDNSLLFLENLSKASLVKFENNQKAIDLAFKYFRQFFLKHFYLDNEILTNLKVSYGM